MRSGGPARASHQPPDLRAACEDEMCAPPGLGVDGWARERGQRVHHGRADWATRWRCGVKLSRGPAPCCLDVLLPATSCLARAPAHTHLVDALVRGHSGARRGAVARNHVEHAVREANLRGGRGGGVVEGSASSQGTSTLVHPAINPVRYLRHCTFAMGHEPCALVCTSLPFVSKLSFSFPFPAAPDLQGHRARLASKAWTSAQYPFLFETLPSTHHRAPGSQSTPRPAESSPSCPCQLNITLYTHVPWHPNPHPLSHLLGQLRQPQRRHGRLLRRLEHHAVAGSQRGAQLPGGHAGGKAGERGKGGSGDRGRGAVWAC